MILRLFIVLALWWPGLAIAAVTEVGTPTLGDGTAGGTSISVARTTTSGSKGLTVQLSYYNGSGAVAAPTCSSATGLGFCLTGGGSSTDNTNAATGVYVTLNYK